MRFVSLEQLKLGMTLSQDIYNTRDGLVAKEKERITVAILDQFKEMDIQGTYVEEGLDSDIHVWSVISPRLRYQAMKALQVVNYDMIFYTAEQIIGEIFKQTGIILDYRDTRAIFDYPYAHNISMAIISTAIGMNLNMNRKTLKELAVAALLCDIGMSHMDKRILNKPQRLDKEEYQKIKMHVKTSYHMLYPREDISEEAKLAVLHHHENEDGSGYPDELYGDDISLMAKILHVADVYDAMSSKRPFKKPYATQDVLEYLMGGCGSLFSSKVVAALSESLPRYQKGTDVLLDGKQVAIIFRNYKDRGKRPFVKTTEGRILDLSKPEYAKITVSARDNLLPWMIEEAEVSRRQMVKDAHRYKIMVVDDQTTNLQIIRDMLEDDYDLTLLKSGEQAITYLEKNKAPDLVLMDINMPGMNGIDTTRRFHKMTGGSVPILFVSTNNDITTVLECRGVGCAGFVKRPYNEVYIKMEIKRILGLEGESYE